MNLRALGLAAALCLLCAPPVRAANTQIDPRFPDPAYSYSQAMTVGSTYPASFATSLGAVPVRGLLISCTGAGSIALLMADGSTVTLSSVQPGIYILPLTAVQVKTSGTTATATYYGLG